MSPQRQKIAIVAVLVLLGGAWWGWSSYQANLEGAKNGGKGARAIPVIVETIDPLPASTDVETVGTGTALKSIDVFAPIAGQVTEILFVAGQSVVEGDVLLRLDNEAQKLAVKLAEVEVQRARQLSERYRKAAPTGGVPASDLDVAKTDLERVQIQMEQARVSLADREIRAPFSGTVGLPLVDVGDRITSATLITTLDDRSEILVSFTVPEIHAGRIVPGMPIDLSAWSLPGRIFNGVIDSAGSRLDPQSRSLTVRARVSNEDDVLRPGMSFGIHLNVPGHAYPAVDEVAVMWGKGGSYIWRVAPDNTAEKIPVQIVRRDGSRVLVDGAVEKGDQIVVEGVQSLRPGAPVEIVATDAGGQ